MASSSIYGNSSNPDQKATSSLNHAFSVLAQRSPSIKLEFGCGGERSAG
jgi:hypothetical protein